MGRDSSTSLAPGFRFHPTDEELVRYYLKRKICRKPLRVDPISETDVYKSEPWELPEKSKLRTRDLEWYFFSALDRKYGNSSRTNRATEKGYWKTTGKDRPIRNGPRTVGMKKTLVYHSGRAPKGARSNWVMHEFRLEDDELAKAGVAQDAFVLCRIFQKSGSGPKNGEQYGAPFVEEEWEDDFMAVVPGEDAQHSEGLIDDGAFFDANEQNLGVDLPSQNAAFKPSFYPGEETCIYVDPAGNFTEHNPSEIAPLQPNFYHGETSNCVELEPIGDFSEADLKPAILGRNSEPANGQTYFEIPNEQSRMDLQPVKDEYFAQASNDGNPVDANYPGFENFLGATEDTSCGEQVGHASSYAGFGISDDSAFDEGLFLETNDLSKPLVADSIDFDYVDEYLNFFDAGDFSTQDLALDSAQVMGTENGAAAEQEPQKYVNSDAELVPPSAQQEVGATHNINEASSSIERPEVTKTDAGYKSPLFSKMLGSIPAPPAFAAEFPSKEAVLRLNSAAQAPSSVHVTAGMIRIRNMNLDVNGTDLPLGKNGNVDLILSYYEYPPADLGASPMILTGDANSGKTSSVVRRGWFLFMFIWVLFISVSCKFGSHIYTRKGLDS